MEEIEYCALLLLRNQWKGLIDCVLLLRNRAPGLPKTRSGKIMRRILRKIAMKVRPCAADPGAGGREPLSPSMRAGSRRCCSLSDAGPATCCHRRCAPAHLQEESLPC